ncbi:MAG: DUF5668 domain-containing protein [Ignavibacteriales bacterium]|nr:DUF5668 domain-containing protein [Ignavibacteriales bacterium]
MKSKHVFWGTLFLTIGVLILINNFTSFNFNWNFVWNLWPLVLVVIGLSFFMRTSEYRWILVGIAALLVGAVLFAGYKNISDFFHPNYSDDEYEVEYFKHPYQEGIKKANLSVNAGVGYLKITDTTDELIDAMTKGSFGNYTFQNNVTDESADLYLEMEEKHFRWNLDFKKNYVEIKLNPNPVWNMDFEVGAEGVDLDLTPFKIADLSLKSGVSSIKIKLGDKSENTHLKFNSGVSKLWINIPKDVGCEIISNTELTKKKFVGFTKVDQNNYHTENFNSSAKKITIDLDVDVSNVIVERY